MPYAHAMWPRSTERIRRNQTAGQNKTRETKRTAFRKEILCVRFRLRAKSPRCAIEIANPDRAILNGRFPAAARLLRSLRS